MCCVNYYLLRRDLMSMSRSGQTSQGGTAVSTIRLSTLKGLVAAIHLEFLTAPVL